MRRFVSFCFRGALVVAITFVVASRALSQSAPPPNKNDEVTPGARKSADFISADGVMIADLVRRMMVNNRELQASRQRLAQAEARLLQAGLRPNPTIDYQYLTDRTFNRLGEREQEFTFTQPFELGGKRRRRMDVAQADVELARYEVADLERQRTADMASLVGQTLSEAGRLFAFERVADLNEAMFKATKLRVQVGDASQYDLTQTEAESARLRLEIYRTANRLESLMIQIKTLAGLGVMDDLKLRDGQLDLAIEELSLDEAVKLAAEQRPDLKSALVAEQEAEARIQLAKAGGVPDVGAIFGFKRTATVSPAPMPSADWQLKAGASVALPIFNRNQGLIQEGAAALLEARLRRENLEQLIRRDVALAEKRLQQARRDLKLYDDTLLPLAQNSVKMAKLGFDLGELHMNDYINEQRRLLDVESAYAQAKAELFLAVTELERAVGKPLRR